MIPDQPVRIFQHLTISTDPVTGEVTHSGDFVEFFRKASDPKPATLAEAKALLRKQVKDPALRALVDKARPGKDDATALIEAVRECAAHAKGATWKAEAKVRDVKAGSVVAVEAKPVEEAPSDEKPVDADPAVEVKPEPEESPK